MKLNIKSKDIYNQVYEKEFNIMSKQVNLENNKEYSYIDEYGECKIRIYDDFVEIFRKGEINSKQVFKLEEITTFKYITKEFSDKYNLFSKKININDKKILIEYDIMKENEIINSIKLEIIEI